MRRKFMTTISAVLVFVMFAGSTLAFAEPVMDVQINQFSALQGVQAEPLTDNEMALVEGKIVWWAIVAVAVFFGVVGGAAYVAKRISEYKKKLKNTCKKPAPFMKGTCAAWGY